jgi:hypothetical protein
MNWLPHGIAVNLAGSQTRVSLPDQGNPFRRAVFLDRMPTLTTSMIRIVERFAAAAATGLNEVLA